MRVRSGWGLERRRAEPLLLPRPLHRQQWGGLMSLLGSTRLVWGCCCREAELSPRSRCGWVPPNTGHC